MLESCQEHIPTAEDPTPVYRRGSGLQQEHLLYTYMVTDHYEILNHFD